MIPFVHYIGAIMRQDYRDDGHKGTTRVHQDAPAIGRFVVGVYRPRAGNPAYDRHGDLAGQAPLAPNRTGHCPKAWLHSSIPMASTLRRDCFGGGFAMS